MPHICPRPCSRLATAAVFISVGVVQVVVGIILLRSKFVYLLAGPDFWTAACNIAVGCLLGLSASIWKQSKKRRTRKDDIRRNVLLALLFSALMINSTTLGMYLLGEGNTLLSIRLESGETTLASEILAYAYVTSVCCPIICIVVTIVAISGSFFNHAAERSLERKMALGDLVKKRSRPLRWVYTPELADVSKKKFRDLILSSSSESSDEEDSEDASISQKRSYSAEDVQYVLNRMAQGKRDSILNDSAMMVRQMNLLRRDKSEMFDTDGSYTGPKFPRSKKYSQDEKRPSDVSQYEDSTPSRTRKSKGDYSRYNGNNRSIQDASVINGNYSNNKQLGSFYKNPITSEELLEEYQRAASKLAHHYPSMYKKFRETHRNKSVRSSDFPSDVNDNEIRDIADARMRKGSEAEQIDIQAELPRRNCKSSVTFKENGGHKLHDNSEETTSPNDCFSPDESYFGADSTLDVSRDSWAGQMIPINKKHSTAAKLSHKLIPVASPVVPDLPPAHYQRKCSEDSGIGNMDSNSFTKAENGDFSKRKSKLSSFRGDLRVGNQADAEEYPKVGTHTIKKLDFARMGPMESISEEPKMEQIKTEPVSEKVADIHGKRTITKGWKGHLRNKSLSFIEPDLSRQTNTDEDISSKDFTPRKKRSASSKALHKIWSLGTSEENPTDFLDQVVDEDSLIGLSEEELIARQQRTRSIRNEVLKRMKEKAST